MHYDTLSGKNALVTGGIGFVGSHLVHRLSELGANVAVLDDFSVGKASNLMGIKARIVRGDVSRRSSWKLKNIDYLFHFAANQLTRSFRNPLRRPQHQCCWDTASNGIRAQA